MDITIPTGYQLLGTQIDVIGEVAYDLLCDDLSSHITKALDCQAKVYDEPSAMQIEAYDLPPGVTAEAVEALIYQRLGELFPE